MTTIAPTPSTRGYSSYAKRIAEILATLPNPLRRADVRHVEAWMRLESGTLDQLTKQKFRAEVRIGAQCAFASTPEDNESLAESYGLGAGTA